VRKLALLLLFTSYLFSTTITNHNIYKQDDSVDLMLTFDKPYLGKITKKKDNDSTILMLENLNITESVTEPIKSKILQKIRILPYKKDVFIKVDSQKLYTLEASKTIDNYGLRIRVKPHILQPIKTKKFETKKEQNLSGSFLKVIAVLGFLLGLLYLLKKWLLNSGKTQSSWLFHKDSSKKQDIKILYQKALDTKNRVALIEYNDMDYLVILGSNNLVLDKFKSEPIAAHISFTKCERSELASTADRIL
jgi:flagellar biogenesis protein FliO